jgi:hypothetical protein
MTCPCPRRRSAPISLLLVVNSPESRYVPDLENGFYNGYRPAGRRVSFSFLLLSRSLMAQVIDEESGLTDRVEVSLPYQLNESVSTTRQVYNIPKFLPDFKHDHPAVVANGLAEIEDFAHLLHDKVLNPLHVLFARALELPEVGFPAGQVIQNADTSDAGLVSASYELVRADAGCQFFEDPYVRQEERGPPPLHALFSLCSRRSQERS